MCKKSISIACHVVGTRYYSPPFSLSEKLKQKAPEFHLKRQPDNIYDRNAIEVYVKHNKSLHQIGHIDRKTAAMIATQMDRGNKCSINLSGKGKIDWKGISVKLTLLSTGYHFGEKTPKISNKYNSGIYKIEIDDGKYWYVGQSSDIKERMKSHFRDLKFGVHGNHMIQNLWVSRKPENFRIKM